MNKSKGKPTSLEFLLPLVAKKMGIESRMKELMIMNYWPEIAKGKIGKDSKPYSITRGKKGLILNIATKSSMVTQELSLIKMVLLDKINILSMQVGLQISEINFSTKYWKENNKIIVEDAPFIGDKLENKYIKSEELKSIKLSKEQKDQIEKILKSVNLEKEDKTRLKNRLEKELKLEIYKERKGHPVCKVCGVVLNNPLADYCPACRF